MKFLFRQYRRPPAGVLQPSFSSLVAELQFQSEYFQNEPHRMDEVQLQGVWQVDTSCKASSHPELFPQTLIIFLQNYYCKASSQALLIQNYFPKHS